LLLNSVFSYHIDSRSIPYGADLPLQVPFKSSIEKSDIAIVNHRGKKIDWKKYKIPTISNHAMRARTNSTLCDSKVKQITGYLDTDDDRHFFFWFFESRSKPSKDPLVLWINGGPGSSSMYGLLQELGPCRINTITSKTEFNPDAWNSNANVIFLDQPVNTGFSYSDSVDVGTSEAAGKDVAAFIQLFLQAFPQYSRLSFHLTGESYAGHFLPEIARVIIDENKEKNKQKIDIKLSSLAIGNPIVNTKTQYGSYPDFLVGKNILNSSEIMEMRDGFKVCAQKIDLINASADKSKYADEVAAACDDVMIGTYYMKGQSVYNIKEADGPDAFTTAITNYLNDPNIQDVLGVDRAFEPSSFQVYMSFFGSGDLWTSKVDDVVYTLDNKVDVLIYAGENDYICNHVGNLKWMSEMVWKGQKNFLKESTTVWTSKSTNLKAGEQKSKGGLSWLKVYNSGHFVPYDQPRHTLEFINEWFSNGSLDKLK